MSNQNAGKGPFLLFSFLFFSFGMITCLNDLLVPYLKGLFSLSYSQSVLVQFSFFLAYFLISLPAGVLVKKIGYKKGVMISLIFMGIGCALFIPAAKTHLFEMFLMALFILAGGIALLQVAANPYIARLGEAHTASRRLTLVQGFNSLGTAIAPLLGGLLFFKASAEATENSVVIPYLGLALGLFVLSVIVFMTHLPDIPEEETHSKDEVSSWKVLTQNKGLFLGVLGIFFYVGSEVAIGSFLINLMGLPEMGGLTEKDASQYVAFYWGGAMVGRFLGSMYMQKLTPARSLFLHSTVAILLLGVSFLLPSPFNLWAILLVGVCNSIMFPTIFSLSLTGLHSQTKQASALLCMAIVGGAILPLIQGFFADQWGLRLSFLIPILGYVYISYFAVAFNRTKA